MGSLLPSNLFKVPSQHILDLITKSISTCEICCKKAPSSLIIIKNCCHDMKSSKSNGKPTAYSPRSPIAYPGTPSTSQSKPCKMRLQPSKQPQLLLLLQ
jgi:hypothetical protein